ncbi:UDP-galactose phosphate transferase [Pleurocapsa sp. CCALA 161]|uniref:sugar transferase n=1 Tax=Pleurocapsa sp. CCALA 161 TaxID=2107688 RepID=UPI000D04889B|nr:sugar transferase [Pleurocapsa sp. CCALA 161]PSB09462.1 UDP-galactose phosphate transferase [Pleurocapsa sp. CCALA 161]
MAKIIKILADRLVAALALLILSPLILVVAIAVRLQMGTPILFTQDRPGKDGRVFQFCKFRTMTDAKNSNGELLPDEQRLSAIGKLLRKTSLDELPQLWHVLKGEMSIVGPRPLLVKYLKLYNQEQVRRHHVLPGITGWAQVNGRRNLDGDFIKKFELDVWYVDNWSLWLDLKIIWLTIVAVVAQKDIDQEGYTTGGGEFLGNDR